MDSRWSELGKHGRSKVTLSFVMWIMERGAGEVGKLSRRLFITYTWYCYLVWEEKRLTYVGSSG